MSIEYILNGTPKKSHIIKRNAPKLLSPNKLDKRFGIRCPARCVRNLMGQAYGHKKLFSARSSAQTAKKVEEICVTHHIDSSPSNICLYVSKEIPRRSILKMSSISIKELKNKAPGHNKISAKILKISSPHITRPLCTIFNSCVDTSIFPSACKKAEVTLGHKKGADTDKTNFWPLSVLPAVGKVLEELMLEQLESVNSVVLHTLISAYRTGYGCQEVLLFMLNRLWTKNNWRVQLRLIYRRRLTACLQIYCTKNY